MPAMGFGARSKIAKNAQRWLKPGETVQQDWFFMARPSGGGGTGVFGLVNIAVNVATQRFYPTVVTDRRVIVFLGGKVSATSITDVAQELPLTTTFGPLRSILGTYVEVGEKRLFLPHRFYKDVEAAGLAAT
jgi:hypothetical protein